MLKRYTAALLCGALALTSALSPVFAAPIINPYAFGGAGAIGTNYDGSTEYTYNTDNGAGWTSSKLLTVSFWSKTSSTGSIKQIFGGSVNQTGGAQTIGVAKFSNEQIWIYASNSATTTILNFLGGADSTVMSDGDWHHFLFSVDLANTSNRYLYIDDIACTTNNWLTYTNDEMDPIISVPNARNGVGAYAFATPARFWSGGIAELYIDLGAYYNLSTESNRRKFIQSDGTPADLGADGSAPSGSSPEIYCPEGDFKDNRGSMADGTDVGTPNQIEGPNP